MTTSSRLTLALLLAAVTAAPIVARPNEQADAEALWNQAVAAKGGRARLETVRNLVVTERTTYTRSPRPDMTTGFTRQRLYVLPARLWAFVDERPGKLGIGFQVFDLELRLGWNDAGRLPDRQGIYEGATYDMLQGQFLYLLETPFLKPEPVATRSGRVGRVPVDIVETRLPGTNTRVEYYLDLQRHLPIRVVVFRTVKIPSDVPLPPRSWTQEERYTLGNYIDVDGLLMPAVAMVEGPNKTNRTSYRINVDFDERTFTPPPPGPLRDPEMAVLNGWQTR